MSVKQITQNTEVDERLAALMTNANAIKVIAQAVEGTIGPKGLDTMLVDKYGEVVITNDGVTILNLMEVNHPAAKMLINIARAQQSEIGDGTTTATILAGELVTNGTEQVLKGVPVARVIEGIKVGVKRALDFISAHAREAKDNRYLKQVALVAGREHEDIADLIVGAAEMLGFAKLEDENFKFADIVCAEVGAQNQVFQGVILNKEPLDKMAEHHRKEVKILIIDDALQQEEISDEALATESGFARYLELKKQFEEHIKKVIALDVGLVLIDRGLDPIAEEIFMDQDVMCVQRVTHHELQKAAEHSGAKMLKRNGLKKDIEELEKYLGSASEVLYDEKLKNVRIIGGKGKPYATILVGASTSEVVGERERIAKDAASAVQAAVKGGIVPGGGAIELAAAKAVQDAKVDVRGMAAYGVDCVAEALKKPFMQIVTNAGFNPLEKLGDVIAVQAEKISANYAIDCDTGCVADMYELGVIDPARVKIHALKAAGEVAEAILRIDTIIKKKEEYRQSPVDMKDI